MWILHALWSLFMLAPFVWLAIFGGLHALGVFLKASKKSVAVFVGLGFLLFCIGWLYKRRSVVGRGLLVTVVGGVVLVWLLAAWKMPEYRFRLFAPLAAVACLVVGFPNWGWLDTHVGDRGLMEVINDLIEGNYNRAAVGRVYPDVTVGKARKVADGFEFHAHANADPTTVLDPAVIGGSVNRGKSSTARNVEVINHPELGTATVRISSTAPPPVLTPWERLAARGPVGWPGPSTTEADAPVVIGFDPHGQRMSIVGPAPDAICHVAVVGAQRRGKSATLTTIAAEYSFRPGVAMIMLDPLGVEFSPWAPRATAVISGVPACRAALPDLLAWAVRRSEAVTALGRRVAPFGPRWPNWHRVIIFVDEVAAIADVRGADPVVKRQAERAMAALTQLSEQMGKFAVQLILATQRPEVGIFEGRLRDNLHSRVGHRHSSGEASRMTTGTGGPDLMSIPLELQGAYYLGSGDVWDPGRSLLLSPHGPVPDDEKSERLAYAAAEVAAATAHLRIPWERLVSP